MRFGVIGLLVALFLVGEGVTRLIETFKFTQLQSMTLAQFEQHPLSEGWIQISGAHTALGNSVMIGTTFDKSEASKPDAAPQTINEYLAPLTDAPGDGSAPAKLYLDSEQADDIALLNRLNASSPTSPISDADEAELQRDRDAPIEGMLSTIGAHLTDAQRATYKVPADAIVIERSRQPRPWWIGALLIAGGLTMLGSIAARVRRYFWK